MKMMRERLLSLIAVLALVATATAAPVGPAASITVSIGTFQIPTVGETVQIPIVMDAAPGGLAGYGVTVSLADPSIAEITAVDFPAWTTIEDPVTHEIWEFNNGADLVLPSGEVTLRAVDIRSEVSAGATGVTLVTLTVRGTAPGIATLSVTPDPVLGIEDENGDLYPVAAPPGTVIVGPTPAEATARVIEIVEGFGLPAPIGTGLTDKLETAASALDRGNVRAAINAVDAFTHQVEAQRGKALEPAQADVLLAEALDLIRMYTMLNPQPEPP